MVRLKVINFHELETVDLVISLIKGHRFVVTGERTSTVSSIRLNKPIVSLVVEN